MCFVGLMSAVICIISPFSLAISISPVSITFGLFAIHLSSYILGMRLGLLSCLIYIGIGLIGLPVFSGFTGGVGILAGPTGGYIIGYVFCSAITGAFSDRSEGKRLKCILGMTLGTIACYIFGSIWLSIQAGLTFWEAVCLGILPYIGFDAVKIALALALGIQLKRALRSAYLI